MEHDFLGRSDDPDRFEAEAAAYCAGRGLDYRYLRTFRAYQAAYSGTVVRDASFLVRRSGQTVGMVHLPVERRGERLSMSIAGGPFPAPSVDDDAAEKAAFARLEEIARAEGVEKVALHACMTNHSWRWNRLRAYGFVDTSALDAIVDLTLDEAALWRSLRQSYKALINKYSNRNGYETVIVDKDNPNRELHETFRHLHAKCAGRVVRDKSSFDLQYQLLLDGNASLLVLRSAQGIFGCAYFPNHGAAVDYWSMADDPDFAPLRVPVSHVLVWAAVRHFKARGFRFLRLWAPAGFAAVEGFGDYAEPKALAIAHFKHGLATDIVPFFRGIRYFTEEAFEADLDMFAGAMRRHVSV